MVSGNRADLVYLHQQPVGNTLLSMPCCNLLHWSRTGRHPPTGICCRWFRQVFPAIPVVFGHTVFDGNDGVLTHPFLPELHQLIAAQFLTTAFMEHAHIFLFIIPEFAVGGIHSDHDL